MVFTPATYSMHWPSIFIKKTAKPWKLNNDELNEYLDSRLFTVEEYYEILLQTVKNFNYENFKSTCESMKKIGLDLGWGREYEHHIRLPLYIIESNSISEEMQLNCLRLLAGLMDLDRYLNRQGDENFLHPTGNILNYAVKNKLLNVTDYLSTIVSPHATSWCYFSNNGLDSIEYAVHSRNLAMLNILLSSKKLIPKNLERPLRLAKNLGYTDEVSAIERVLSQSNY